MRLAKVLVALYTIPLSILKGACPSMQKFDGSLSTGCALGNQGSGNNLQCDTAVQQFTLSGWMKMPTNDSFFASSTSNVYFSIQSPTETYKRMVLKYAFNNGVGGFRMLVGDSGNPANLATLTPGWSLEDSQAKYNNKRDKWFHFLMAVTGASGSKKIAYRISEFTDTPQATPFYHTVTGILSTSSSDTINLAQDDFKTDTKIYFGGFPLVGAFPANTEWGGCGQINHVVYMPNYAPSLTADDELVFNHLFERTSYSATRLVNYYFRIKNVANLGLVSDCDVPDDVKLLMQTVSNDYVKKGIQFGYGDYYECVNEHMIQRGDLVLSLRVYFTELPSEAFNLVSLLYKTPSNFYAATPPNGKLPVWFHLIKLGIFLESTGGLTLYHMGLPFSLTATLTANTGYTISLVSKRYEDSFYTGYLGHRRLFYLYVNGARVQNFTLLEDYQAFVDTTNTGIERNHFLYIGDFMTRSINRYNYAFVTPNPLNDFGPNGTERGFTNTFVNLQDIVLYENATLTREPNMLPSNCILGVPFSGQCLVCGSGYALDISYLCALKSALPSYVVLANNHDLTIECGIGLFYNTALQICQNCPSDCAVCNSITDCVISVSPNCVSNCAKCYKATGICIACSDGYALNTGTNTCVKCLITSGTNPCYSCNAATPSLCLKCFDGFFYNTGSSSCDPCSGCATCSGSALTCLSCGAGKYLNGTSCPSLPNNMYLWKNVNITRYCFPTCTSCTTSEVNKCTSCYSNYIPVYSVTVVKLLGNTHSCDSKCPTTHYLTTIYNGVAGTYCLPCETLITNCIMCYQKIPSDKALCQKCKSGFYVLVNVANFFENSCGRCDTNCVECSGSSSNCLSCASGQILQFDQGSSSFSCVSDTRSLATTNRVCPYNKFLYQGQCLDACPVGTYRRRYYTDDCASCDVATSGCYACNTATAICTDCQPIYKFNTLSKTCFLCNQNNIQCCDIGYGTNAGTCSSVCSDANAADCLTPAYSTLCKTNYVLSTTGVCKTVVTNCNSYDYQATTCLLCSASNVYTGAACAASCTGALISAVRSSRIVCDGCHTNCLTCTQPSTNNRCPTCKTPGYYQSNLGCIQCPYFSMCGTWGAANCTCTTCSSGSLTNGVCVQCPEGYFLNAGACSACAGCKTCTSAANAGCTLPKTCLSNYRLSFDGSNTACCTPGQYYISSTCTSCVANCDTCTGTTVATCQVPKKGYYIGTGPAIMTCDTNFLYCTNGNTAYESGEACKYGSTSSFVGTAWSSSCLTAALPTNCLQVFNDGTQRCAFCSATTYLDLGATPPCVASCGAGKIGIKNIVYKFLGVNYTGHLCVPTLTHTISFGDLYYLNVNTCENGYYIFKTSSLMKAYLIDGADYELILCGKCHSTCQRCFDFSKHACTKCSAGSYLYMSTCITACPAGYEDDGTNVCILSLCQALYYKYNKAGTNICTKKCPIGYFANNATWTCDACNAACSDCWGAAATDCRVCAAAATQMADGKGNCITCTTGTYMDAHYDFACAPGISLTSLNNMPASAASSDPGLTGVSVLDATNAAQTKTVDANSFLTVPAKNLRVTLPDLTYIDTRTCYRYLVEFDLTFGSSSAQWNNFHIYLKDAGTSIATIDINQWDFEQESGFYTTTTTFKKRRVFLDNLNCTKQTLKLEFSTDLTTAGNWGVRNVRNYWYYCPLDCISCQSSTSCLRCQESKFFYVQPNECQVPYTSLLVDEPKFIESYSFLFKPKSVYLYFSKEMNFTLGQTYEYFFPTFTTTSSRLLQEAVSYTDIKTYFVGNNFMELKIDSLETAYNKKGYYSFKYALVDKDRVGYSYTSGVPVVYLANNPVTTLLNTYINILVNNKSIFRYVMTGLSLVLVYAFGANWFMIENCQKMYLILFLTVTYSKDIEHFLDLMDFSFFGWFQILHEMFLGKNIYWDMIKYDEYISNYDISRGISKSFLGYIPENRLGKYLVRKSFIVHALPMLIIFAFFAVFFVIFKPIRWFLIKKYYYKEAMVTNLNAVNSFLHFKVFVRFILITFVPFIFYGLANMSKIEMGSSLPMISAIACFVVLGVWAVAWLQYFISAFFMPTEADYRAVVPNWKMICVVPFEQFMVYYKNPDPLNTNRQGTEDDDDDKVKKEVVNDHMVLKNVHHENEVFTLIKDELKKGGAKIFKPELDAEELKRQKELDKKKKKKKNPGFISIQKVREREIEELKKKTEEPESASEDDKKSSSSSSSSSDKEGDAKKDGKEDKKEKEDTPDKEGKKKESKDEKDGNKKKESEESESSSDDDKSKSSDDEMVEGDVRNIGKLLARSLARVEKGPGCCECKRIRKNKCLRKFNHLMERTAKFYTLMKLLHMAVLAGLIWYFSEKTSIQVIVFAATQTMLFLWTVLARPFDFVMLNVSAILVEFLFMGVAWLLFMLNNPFLTTVIRQVFYLIILILFAVIFVVSLFTFLAFFVTAMIKWLLSLGGKDPL